MDIERLQRVNRTLAVLEGEDKAFAELTPIDVLVIAPSQRLDPRPRSDHGKPHGERA